MNGRPVTEEERERIISMRQKGLSVNTIALLVGRAGKVVRRISDDHAPFVERKWSPGDETIRFLQKSWHWVNPRKPKKNPVRRGLITPNYYPAMFHQLPEEERPWWYHED